MAAFAHHLVLGVPPHCGCSVSIEDRRRAAFSPRGGGAMLLSGKSVEAGGMEWKRDANSAGFGHPRTARFARSVVPESPPPPPSSDGALQLGSAVDIPVTCYQIIGVSEKAEKDEIVKAVLELKKVVIDEGYTPEVSSSRQDLLVDVRDKLLFEPMYAGNMKEKIPAKSVLHIPWNWLPAALSLLQEVGEEKSVLEIGRTALQCTNSKPYIHDLLLAMTLAECSIAKVSFEKGKVSDGFEALARAQNIMKSRASLGKLPLLGQIEESLEELAPACTLELLSLPSSLDNADRRRGAIAALRELLRQGLGVESSCKVEDWPCFLSQALSKMMAAEIVELLTWDALALTRKNKKLLESQNQRAVVDFNCFYTAMIAHVAFGFATRQSNLVSKAKSICECLITSDTVDLKIEETFCSFLLREESAAAASEKLQQIKSSGNSNSQSYGLSKEKNDKDSINHSLEMWLKDAVLSRFPDTQDCTPSLADYFGSPRRTLDNYKQMLAAPKVAFKSSNLPSFNLLAEKRAAAEQMLPSASNGSTSEAVLQLSSSDVNGPATFGKSVNSASPAAVTEKLTSDLNHGRTQESKSMRENIAGKLAYATITGCLIIGALKIFNLQWTLSVHKFPFHHSKRKVNANFSATRLSEHPSPFIAKCWWDQLGKLSTVMESKEPVFDNGNPRKNSWADNNISPVASVTGVLFRKRLMNLEHAKALVKQWQDIKSEALGPNYRTDLLYEILDKSMHSKWKELAESAKARSCFWRFVLLNLDVTHAEMGLDDEGEVAAIEAIIEEAAELVDSSQPKKPSYYSTYKVRYTLRKLDDSPWRFCDGCVQN